MRISVKEAEQQLPELLERASRGIEVTLTQENGTALEIVPISWSPLQAGERMEVFKRIREKAKGKPLTLDVSAARSQDFLYDENGLPA